MAARQGIVSTTHAVGTSVSRTRSRPRTSSKIRSIATRTLAVAASLWSPSRQQNGDAFPLPGVDSFRLEVPRRIGSKYPRATNNFNGPNHCWHHQHHGCRSYSPFHQYVSRRSLVSMTKSTEDESITAVSSIESTSHLPRLFVQLPGQEETIAPLRKNSLVTMTADQEHYLLDVMRITNPKRWGKKTGTNSQDYTGCVRIFNGSDGEWLAKVVVSEDAPTTKKQSRRKRGSGNDPSTTVLECLEELRPQEASNSIQIDLCLGYIRDKQRRRFVFEKATELGVNSIQILETDFCNTEAASYKKKKDLLWEEEEREKHEKHVIEAAEQCERLTVPVVGDGVWTVDTLVSEVILDSSNDDETKSNDLWLVCRERSETSPPILSVLEEATGSAHTIHVLVGPEGGWSPRELEILSSVQAVKFVSLGSSVLRAETAAITAVASIQMHQETKSD